MSALVREHSALMRKNTYACQGDVERVEDRPEYPTTLQQQERLEFQCMYPRSIALNMPCLLRLTGALEIGSISRGISLTLAAHSILRTIYKRSGPVWKQIILEDPPAPLTVDDCPPKCVDEAIVSFIRPFDLTQNLPVRFKIWKAMKSEWLLQVDMHHVAMDEWTFRRVFADFRRACAGEPAKPERLRYADFAVWQTEGEGRRALAELGKSWRAIHGPPAQLPKISDLDPASGSPTHAGCVTTFDLPNNIVSALRSLATNSGTTLQMVLQAIWILVIAKFSGLPEVIIGIPVAGRDRPALQHISGLFVNNLPVRISVDRDHSFRALLSQVKWIVLQAIAHQLCPYAQFARDEYASAGFEPRNVTFTYHDKSDYTQAQLGSMRAEQIPVVHQASRFELTLTAEETQEGVRCLLRRALSLSHAKAEEIMIFFIEMSAAVAQRPDASAGQIMNATYRYLEKSRAVAP